MGIRDYAVVLSTLALGVFLGGCGGDDSSGGGASGASGASGGGLSGSAGSTGTAGTTGTAGAAGSGSAGSSSGGSAGMAAGGMGGAGGSMGASDAGGSATDITMSAECNAYCAKIEGMCMDATCDRAFSCRIRAGDCAASTRAFLKCTVDTGQFSCSAGGAAVVTTCKRDNTLCM